MNASHLGNGSRAGGAITRGTTDIGNLKHYTWRSPSGEIFDLLIESEVINGRLILRDFHIMPQTGFNQTRLTLGRDGLRQLQCDLGQQFGADTIEIPNRIGRTTGRSGGFGPGEYPIPK